MTAQIAWPGDVVGKRVNARRRFVIGRVVRVNRDGLATSFRPFGEQRTISIRPWEFRFVVSQSQIDVAAIERAMTRRRTSGFRSIDAVRKALARYLKGWF